MGIKEEVFYDGGPHIGDLILNILIGFTVIGLPLTVGAIVRALWLRYRITNRRISITSGWMGQERADVVFSEIASIVKVPRGFGLWGDMVVTLKNGSRLEMKSVPKFREIEDFINEKIAQAAQKAGKR